MSKLNFKDPAESSLVNDAFLGRSVDDETTGKLDLINADPISGDSVLNIQRKLNENQLKVIPLQSISNGGFLSSDNISKMQIKRVVGSPAAITVNSAIFGNSPDIQDGSIFYIIGTDDINSVTIEHNDIDDGAILNGNATLKNNFCIQLLWSSSDKRFLDIGRNF